MLPIIGALSLYKNLHFYVNIQIVLYVNMVAEIPNKRTLGKNVSAII